MENMTISEALDVLEAFCNIYEVKSKETDRYDGAEQDYQATKIILREYKNLRKDLLGLINESLEREKRLTELEAELINALKSIKNGGV